MGLSDSWHVGTEWCLWGARAAVPETAQRGKATLRQVWHISSQRRQPLDQDGASRQEEQGHTGF